MVEARSIIFRCAMRAMLWLISAMLLAVGCTRESHEAIEREISIAYLGSKVRYEAVLLKEDIAIRGRIVATDKMDEIEKRVVIADHTSGIELKIDSNNADLLLPLYAEATVHCSGLYLAREGGRLVLGRQPSSVYSVDRLSESDIARYVSIDTSPTAPPEALPRTIGQITGYDLLCYVRIDDVEFVESGSQWLDFDENRPQHTLRHITDGVDTLGVAVNDATIYGSELLPTGKLNCYGIVDSYKGDLVLRIINKQAIRQ